MRENRETLLSTDESTAVILEPIGEGQNPCENKHVGPGSGHSGRSGARGRGDGKVAAGGAGAAAAGSIWTTIRRVFADADYGPIK